MFLHGFPSYPQYKETGLLHTYTIHTLKCFFIVLIHGHLLSLTSQFTSLDNIQIFTVQYTHVYLSYSLLRHRTFSTF